MRQTTLLKKESRKKEWYIINAKNLVLGRMASEIAKILKGKNKPEYTPNVDCGDYVIVINAKDVYMSGTKMKTKKYYNHSQYPGGLRIRTAKTMYKDNPCYIVEHAVRLMLAKKTLGRQTFKHLFVYSDDKHPHSAQNPKVLKLDKGINKNV